MSRTLSTILAVVSLTLTAAPAPAQSTAASAAGTWAGSLQSNDGWNAAVRVSLTVEDGTVTGLVTGPQLTPGDVKGTYDLRTGALAFTVALQGSDTKIDFRGAVSGDTLRVRAEADGRSLALQATRTSDVAERPAVVPETPLDPAAAAVRRSFTEVGGWVRAASRAVPADRYGYRPTASVRTFAQLIGHVADGLTYYCGRAMGQTAEWSEAVEKGPNDRGTLLRKLDEALAVCDRAYAGGVAIGPLVENVGHTSLHYGNLVTYMRMMGLVPPSS